MRQNHNANLEKSILLYAHVSTYLKDDFTFIC